MGYFQYRGAKDLVFAEILEDSQSNYTTGAVFSVPGIKSIAKDTTNNTETVYADDLPVLVSNSEGESTYQIEMTGILPEIIAKLTGQTYLDDYAALVEGQRQLKYFAMGYKSGTIGDSSDIESLYNWVYKVVVTLGSQTNQTKDSSATSNGLTLQVTSIATNHPFIAYNDSGAKAMQINTKKSQADLTNFFSQVTTPDTLQAARVATPTAAPTPPATLESGNTVYLSCSTDGAAIYYTTDGSTTPSMMSTLYTGGITLTSTTTIKAKAFKSDMEPSGVLTAVYTIE